MYTKTGYNVHKNWLQCTQKLVTMYLNEHEPTSWFEFDLWFNTQLKFLSLNCWSFLACDEQNNQYCTLQTTITFQL